MHASILTRPAHVHAANPCRLRRIVYVALAFGPHLSAELVVLYGVVRYIVTQTRSASNRLVSFLSRKTAIEIVRARTWQRKEDGRLRLVLKKEEQASANESPLPHKVI